MSEEGAKVINDAEVYICKNCGGNMVFDIKSQSLKCPYCDEEVEIKDSREIREFDFNRVHELENNTDWNNTTEVVKCESCGGETVIERHQSAAICSFCGSSKILKSKQLSGIKPEAIIPFKIDKYGATEVLERWMKKRWLSPNNLKHLYQSEKMTSMYVPYWTYDAYAYSRYTGRGGQYYYVTEQVDGKSVRVRKTRWYSVNGSVNSNFDDIQVNASRNFDENLIRVIEPFNTNQLQPFRTEFISGYVAERYSKGVKDCFSIAKYKMEQVLEDKARNDILRRYDVASDIRLYTNFKNVTYKHVLLPIWTAHYDYAGKKYKYIINGQTGKVHGKYPLSALKIILLIILVIVVLALVFYFNN